MFNKAAMSKLAPTTPNMSKSLQAKNVIGKKKKRVISEPTSPLMKAFGK